MIAVKYSVDCFIRIGEKAAKSTIMAVAYNSRIGDSNKFVVLSGLPFRSSCALFAHKPTIHRMLVRRIIITYYNMNKQPQEEFIKTNGTSELNSAE